MAYAAVVLGRLSTSSSDSDDDDSEPEAKKRDMALQGGFVECKGWREAG
jgi:hypothetical protein